MLNTARRRTFQEAFPSICLTSFTLFHRTARSRSFTTTLKCPSQIGRTPLSIPPSVTFSILAAPTPKNSGRTARGDATSSVQIRGPLGEISMPIPSFLKIDHDAVARKAIVKVVDRGERHQREMWGTTRAYLANHLLGVSEGHTTLLRLVGVGYRATVESTATTVTPAYPGQKFVSLKVGYSHPIELGVPIGVTASTPLPTRILLEGVEKETVNQFAAKIRMWRKPEPYKGKGVFVNDETVKIKAKKIK